MRVFLGTDGWLSAVAFPGLCAELLVQLLTSLRPDKTGSGSSQRLLCGSSVKGSEA